MKRETKHPVFILSAFNLQKTINFLNTYIVIPVIVLYILVISTGSLFISLPRKQINYY